MVHIIIFDTGLTQRKLYPLSLTRPVCDIRHGLFTQREWYSLVTGAQVFSVAAPYLPGSLNSLPQGPFLCIDSSVVPNAALFNKLLLLKEGCSLEDAEGIIAYVSAVPPLFDRFPLFFRETIHTERVMRIAHPMDWVKSNARKMLADIELLDKTGLKTPDNDQNRVFGIHPVWMEIGAKASGVIFNTEEGPVFLGKNSKVMEGTCIKGPVAVMEGGMVKMGAQIYQGTTIGKFAVAGGEIKNSILGDFSNKAHHGYLGDSIIGRWCNLGAGTTNSNVKNNAGEINMWSEALKKMVPAGEKAGMVMGDYSKTAINSSINTGSTIGVCCSLHRAGFHEKHIPSFSWGPGETYDLKKAVQDIANWFQFKNCLPEEGLESILEHLWRSTKTT